MTDEYISNLEKIYEKFTRSKSIQEGVLLIENTTGDFSFSKSHGGKEIHTPILMASITKLLTTACILALYDENQLTLKDKITDYFDEDSLRGLHVFKGKEFTSQLTIADLLFQVSGLPDAFVEGKDSLTNLVLREDFPTPSWKLWLRSSS